MLKIEELTKFYGKNRGVENINLEINKGEIFGFIGPNGAGKSTTIKCIMNLINKNSGRIFIDGVMSSNNNPALKDMIGYLPSEIHLYDDLTVKQMLEYSSSFYDKDCSKKISYLVKKLDLDLNKKIDELSLGNLKKVGIVIALMHDPTLIILDEATSGLDPLMQEVFYELLLEEQKKGNTIFFSSHNLNEIKKICNRVGIIKEGTLIKIESINELMNVHFSIVTVYSKSIKEISNNLDINILKEDNDMIKFTYKNSMNELIKMLSKYEIDKLLIEEPSIEEIFMHYYK